MTDRKRAGKRGEKQALEDMPGGSREKKTLVMF